MVAAIAQQAKLLGLEAPRQLEIMHKPAPLPTRVLELTEEEWTAQFANPPRLVNTAKPLKQIRAEKRPKTTAIPEPVAEGSPMPGALWLDLDEELE
ncbi:hypothetical protein [Mycoplana dimorpha]|uniref:Uncharacterized protein n=1 Tax=Mycoplana dimorpha TaxID=28320 RepID=A0A2T5BBY7_MYCDI|nr:hypothetical protein [Mycoplana dimorpha]PTM96491.1 hypothetical protein C7449_103510 [Mycoplana dimorpha]